MDESGSLRFRIASVGGYRVHAHQFEFRSGPHFQEVGRESGTGIVIPGPGRGAEMPDVKLFHLLEVGDPDGDMLDGHGILLFSIVARGMAAVNIAAADAAIPAAGSGGALLRTLQSAFPAVTAAMTP